MIPQLKPICHGLLGEMQILLHGVPCRTSRGWLGYCSIVLLRIGGEPALYDTGHFSDRAILLDMLKHSGLAPSDIRLVILSHLHFDHILNVPLFRKAALVVSRAEVDHALGVSAGQVDDPAVPENWFSLLAGHELVVVDGPVAMDRHTEIVPLPGHTPGGLVVFRHGFGTVAICGDVIKNAWDAVNGSPGSAGVDAEAAGRSIKHVLGRARTIIPGHDRPFSYSGESVEFLSPFGWQVSGSLLPGPRDEILLDIDLPVETVKAAPKG